MDDLKDVDVDEGKSVSTSAVNYEDKRVSLAKIYFERQWLIIWKWYNILHNYLI